MDGSYFHGARIAQHAFEPDPQGDVVRVVIELAEWQPYRAHLSEDRTQLQIDFPLPGHALPSDAPPVVLSDFNFRRLSSQVALATLVVSGKPVLHSGTCDSPPSVWVDIENADNKVRNECLSVSDHCVKEATLAPAPDQKGVERLTLSLAESVPCSVSCDRSQVRLLLGRCELTGLTVAVDAGHGGSDTGAIGRSGLMEKDVALDIAMRVGKLLEEAGAKVLYTRCDDTLPRPPEITGDVTQAEELLARCAVANEGRADLFVAIHCNARGKDPLSVRGTETYYRKEESRPFAQVMQEEVVRSLGIPDGGALRHPKAIVVLYRTEMPAVLVEVAYLSNPADEALLQTSEFRQQSATGIVNGVRRYVSESSLLETLLNRQTPARGEGARSKPLPPRRPWSSRLRGLLSALGCGRGGRRASGGRGRRSGCGGRRGGRDGLILPLELCGLQRQHEVHVLLDRRAHVRRRPPVVVQSLQEHRILCDGDTAHRIPSV